MPTLKLTTHPLLIIIIIIIGNLQNAFRNSKRFTIELKEKHTMRKYTSVQKHMKINKHFHTKHGKNASTQDRSHTHELHINNVTVAVYKNGIKALDTVIWPDARTDVY